MFVDKIHRRYFIGSNVFVSKQPQSLSLEKIESIVLMIELRKMPNSQERNDSQGTVGYDA